MIDLFPPTCRYCTPPVDSHRRLRTDQSYAQHLESAARPHLLQLFQHLSHRPVHLGRQGLLLGIWQQAKRLAQIPVNHLLDGRVIASVGEVISTAERGVVAANVLGLLAISQ